MRDLRSLLPLLIFTALYAALSLSVTNSYYQLVMTLVPVWAVFGLSWNLLSGYTGLISFGHAAFFGIGAYTTALGQIYFDLSPWALIPIAAVLGGIAGLLIGYPTFRLQGHYFALAMLAYPLAILYVFEWLGFQEVTLPIKRENPIAYMQFADPRMYTLVALAIMLATILLTRIVEQSRFGMALLAIKQNEAAAEAAGINALAWKLRAIVLSGAIAAAIGAFYAVVLLVVTPQSVFGMLVSAQALTVAMFGGVGTVWGPVIGSVILIPLAETLNAEAGSRFPGIQGVIFGLAIICVILIAPEGLFWKIRDLLRRKKAAPAAAEPQTQAAAAVPASPRTQHPQQTSEVVLEVRNLSKSFGGLKAVQDVSFKLHRNEILGIIGPNGAGKTTLFDVIAGETAPDAGRILLDGISVDGLPAHARARRGLARTFQECRVLGEATCLENLLFTAQPKSLGATIARTASTCRRVSRAATSRRNGSSRSIVGAISSSRRRSPRSTSSYGSVSDGPNRPIRTPSVSSQAASTPSSEVPLIRPSAVNIIVLASRALPRDARLVPREHIL